MLHLDIIDGSEEDLACAWSDDIGIYDAGKKTYWSTSLTLWLEQLVKISDLSRLFPAEDKKGDILNAIFCLTWP